MNRFPPKELSDNPGGPSPCRQFLWAGAHPPDSDWSVLLRGMGLEPVMIAPDQLKEEAFYRYPSGVVWACTEEWHEQPALFRLPDMLPVWTLDPASKQTWALHLGYEGPMPSLPGPSEERRLERGIKRYLHHRRAVDFDSLTGLPNRPSFEGWLRRAMYWNPNQDWYLGFVDVLGMTDTNRMQGYVAGDRKLRQFARMLAAHLPANAPHCRWGGDEFLVAVPSENWRPPAECRSALCPLGNLAPSELQRMVDRLHDRLRRGMP